MPVVSPWKRGSSVERTPPPLCWRLVVGAEVRDELEPVWPVSWSFEPLCWVFEVDVASELSVFSVVGVSLVESGVPVVCPNSEPTEVPESPPESG